MDIDYILRILRQPFGLTLEKTFAKAFGSTSRKELFGLLKRPNYAYGMFRAAQIAKYFEKKKVTVCEFGVAGGIGLINMAQLARKITPEIGIEFRIVGFDSASGLPEVQGYKDHPEIWSPGDFPMTNKEELLAKLKNAAELVIGDIKNTVADFVDSIETSAPLGFISIDVDIYSGAKAALECLRGKPENYNPAVSIYLDDTRFFFANKWCGELAAIEEFNSENEFRKIDKDRALPGSRPLKNEGWYEAMHVCHILDNPMRKKPIQRSGFSLSEHECLMRSAFPG